MSKIHEIISKNIESGFLEKRPLSPIDIRLESNDKEIKRHHLNTEIKEHQLYLGCYRPKMDIYIGQKFDVVFPSKNLLAAVKIDARLIALKVSPSVQSDFIPRGYSAVCLLEFSKEVPESFTSLPISESKWSSETNDIFFLTTQEVFDKISKDFEREFGYTQNLLKWNAVIF
jgi:hypothetical protein